VFTGGTLQIAGANIASSLPVTLQSQGGTIDTNGNNATLSGTISGPGTLVKVGAGTLTLTGNNSYQGGTALNAGTLAVGSNTALGTGALTFADGTTLQAAGNGLSLANAMVLNGARTRWTRRPTRSRLRASSPAPAASPRSAPARSR
jgi:autotransporter-associated beta strand protein